MCIVCILKVPSERYWKEHCFGLATENRVMSFIAIYMYIVYLVCVP